MTADAVTFAPFVPWAALYAILALGAGLCFYSLWRGAKGALLRALAVLALAGFLANPAWREEERTPLSDIAAIVVDKSGSQQLGARGAATEAAATALEQTLNALSNVETRRVEASAGDDGTRLMAPLERALADTPRSRLGAVFFVTDGQILDAEDWGRLGAEAPAHVLLTGEAADTDRKLTLLAAPRYGIVGEEVDVSFRIDDLGPTPGTEADIEIRLDGDVVVARRFAVGEPVNLKLAMRHPGANILEIETPERAGELTALNNAVALPVVGVRDRLRVLLVSGEPHAGERTWRNLLKSDPAVDLVHFTILRPMEKDGGAPQEELALIPFPVRELFEEKLDEFDLIIFDRYRLRGVLSFLYFRNILDYVRNGGALLTASGPELASRFSLSNSVLEALLPAVPTGKIVEEGYRPGVTDEGARHPVTAELGAGPREEWGRWFRLVEAQADAGVTLMTGPEERPLLILDRQGEGRVAQMLTDQAWLWARGVEGGGPHAELLRRLAHWLMQEPDLEEEDLSLEIAGGKVVATRRTLADAPANVALTAPDGTVTEIALRETVPGLWRGATDLGGPGLYRAEDGDLYAIAATGAVNPAEYADVLVTDENLRPLAAASGGGVFTVQRGTQAALPDIRAVREGRQTARDTGGRGWAGVVRRNQYEVRAVAERPLLPAWGWLALIGVLLLGAWLREGRG